MATMNITEETPTKIVLKMDIPKKQSNEFTWRTCAGYVFQATIFLIIALIWVGYSYLDRSSTWLFWTILIGALILESFMVIMVVFLIFAERVSPKDITVSIDLNTQRAIRFEKLNSGKTQEYNLRLGQIGRVLIHGNKKENKVEVILDSRSNSPFRVNSDTFTNSESMKELGNKIGKMLKKPVVFKVVDGELFVSEETIQN